MSRTTNESDDGMLSKDQTGSPSIDEGSSGGTILKKGPWTASEDAILMEYVKKHGEGNWNAVQKHSGLFRCGKSCRLRWANHLRPNLKKGAFTAEEERMIIELHAKMGNKWARMAAHLPGRTDNEIKNYWNTRIKRRQRAGLPLYPPELCLQTLNEGQQNQSAGEFSSRESQHHVLQSNNYDIPEVVFDNLKTNPLSFAPFPDISVSSMLTQGLVPPQSYSFMPSMFSRSKRIRESETLMPSFSETLPNGISLFDQLSHEPCEKIHHRTFNMGGGFYYDTNPTSKNQTPFGGLSGSHAFLNGNFTAASKPISGPVKLELPSIQFQELETGLDLWGATSPPLPPSLEAVDTYIQSPPPTIQVQADCISPRDSGLLEALLHEARTRNSGKNHSSEKCSSSSVVTPAEMDSSELNFCDREWGEYGDPISPVAHSAASVFSECTPSCSSFDRTPPDEALLGRKIKIEKVDLDLPSDVEVKDTSTCLDFSRPDALLNADWFDQNECAKDLAALLSDDFCDDCKPVAGGTTSSSQNEGWGYGSCSWNNMTTAVYQMSELP